MITMKRVFIYFCFFIIVSTQVKGEEINSSKQTLEPNEGLSSVTYEEITESSIVLDTSTSSAKETSQSDINPIFQVIKDFLFQERQIPGERSLSSTDIPDLPPATEADTLVEIINSSIRDAVSTIKDHIEAVTPIDSLIPKTEAPLDEKSEISPLSWGGLRFGFLSGNKKSETFSELTGSCSSCYSSLSSCVQKCFADNNCKNVEREARKCPPVPTSFCNPFTPWTPVDQCQNDSDCESPLLCCNDGCVNKCSEGIWK